MGFTGHVNDATGLTYMQARFYDPVTGRFLSVDPMTFMGSGNNPAMYNRFSYCYNDPVGCTDPDGEIGIWGAVVGAVAEAVIIKVEGGGVFSKEGLARVGISAAAGAVGVGLGAKAAQAAKLGSKLASKTLPAGSNPVKVGNALAGAADGAVSGATAGATSHVLSAEGKQTIGVGEGATLKSTALAAVAGGVTGGAQGAVSGSVQGAAKAGDISSAAADSVSNQAAIFGEGAGIIVGASSACNKGDGC